MTRRKDWEDRLYKTIEAARRKPLRYGSHDCALFAADCIEAVTGVDLSAQYRDQYRTMAAARRIVAGDLALVMDSNLTRVQRAKRGDIVGIPHSVFGVALGVCDGLKGIFLSRGGLVWRPRSTFSHAWRVG